MPDNIPAITGKIFRVVDPDSWNDRTHLSVYAKRFMPDKSVLSDREIMMDCKQVIIR